MCLRRRLLFATLLSCCSVTTPAAEPCPGLDPSLQRILQAMTSTASCGDYRGVVTLQRGSDMQVMEIAHRVQDGRATKVLARLTGQEAQVLRDAYPAACRDQGQDPRRAQLSRGAEDGVCGLALSYRFDLGPGERIAGREALRLRAEPRDMYRFGYVFELDADTALVLKATTLAADARVLEEFQFASLSMEDGAADGSTVERAEPGGARPDAGQQLRGQSGPAWRVGWLPPGFAATETASDEAQRKSYSDGLATFSIFVEPLGVAIRPGEGIERQGSTVAYTRGVRLREEPMLITVLGEIPTNTARMVADSVRLR